MTDTPQTARDDTPAIAAHAKHKGLDAEDAATEWRFLAEKYRAHWREVADGNAAAVAETPETRTVIVESPNKPRPDDPLTVAVADTLRRVENNYHREGSGPGSRFEGELLEDVQARTAIAMVRSAQEPKPAPQPDDTLSRHVAVRVPADMIAAVVRPAANEGMTVSAWIRREVEREAARREQPAPEPSARAIDWTGGTARAQLSRGISLGVTRAFQGGVREGVRRALPTSRPHHIAEITPEPTEIRQEAEAIAVRACALMDERDKYRELLDEVGVMAANAPEEGDSFGLLEQIAMRIAAADVPDTTPIDEWPDPENPVTGRTPGAVDVSTRAHAFAEDREADEIAAKDDGVSVDIGSPEDGDHDRCEPTL